MAAFDDVAATYDGLDVTFGSSVGNADVANAAGVDSTPAVIIFKPFDDGRAVYTGALDDAAALMLFVTAESLPLIVPYSADTAPAIFGGAIDNHVLLFVDMSEPSSQAVLAAARPTATERRGQAIFVTLDKTDDRVLEFFDVNPETDFPTARVVHMTDESIEKYEVKEGATLDENTIKELVDAYFAGELTQSLKSEEAPAEPQPAGAVHVIVGTSFEEKVNAAGKNVFVEFYAPWCGHCKSLAPVWEELAQKYKDEERVVIAKVDATANEVERVLVTGFPTLKLFPADSGEIVDYEGERDLEALSGFVDRLLGADAAAA